MNSADALTTSTDRILHALALGELTKGELLAASGLNSSSELDAVLAQLGDEVTMHWGERRTYRLAETKPTPPWWMLPPKPG